MTHARCPGCGDSGDAAHMTACVTLKRDELLARGWRNGAEFVLAAVRAQLGRRGAVDVEALADAVEALASSSTASSWR